MKWRKSRGKSILVRVSASFELVRVPVIRSRLYTHAALCYSRTKFSSHGWIFCFLSCKTGSSTRFSIVCSRFSQWTVNLLLNGTVPVLPFVTLSYPVTLCYPALPFVTLCYPLLLFVSLCYLVLPCVTLCYLMLPSVTLCFPVLHCVTLCYPVLPFVTLCDPVLPSVTLCFPLLFVTLCYPLLGCVALSLPRRRFKWSSFFIPPQKRLFSRKQHSFPIVLFAW